MQLRGFQTASCVAANSRGASGDEQGTHVEQAARHLKAIGESRGHTCDARPSANNTAFIPLRFDPKVDKGGRALSSIFIAGWFQKVVSLGTSYIPYRRQHHIIWNTPILFRDCALGVTEASTHDARVGVP